MILILLRCLWHRLRPGDCRTPGRAILLALFVLAALATIPVACSSGGSPGASTTLTSESGASASASTTSGVVSTTVSSQDTALSAALEGTFPADLTSADAIVHSRAVITREGQPLPVAFDFWWQQSSGRYRIERRFGSSPVLAEAQVFTGARLMGFVAAGTIREAFDMTYEESQKLNEIIDPLLVTTMESARVKEAKRLIEAGALEETGREEFEGRVVVCYQGSVAVGNEGSGQGNTAPMRSIFVDDRTGLVVEESLAEGDRVLYQALRDYEVIEADEFEALMALTIPPGYGPSTAGGTGQGKILTAVGPEACAAALSDLANWLPSPLYYLGDSFVDSTGTRFIAREVQTTNPRDLWTSFFLTVEDAGGLAGGSAGPPFGYTVLYLSEQINQDGKALSVTVQDPALAPEGSAYPLAFWKKIRDIEADGYTDTMYQIEQTFIYLARRGEVVVVLISSLDEKDVLAAASALQPFEGVAP